MRKGRLLQTAAFATTLVAVAVALTATAASCARPAGGATIHRVVILGLDGLDYDLTTRLMKEGRLPGLSRLAGMGGFSALGTSVPAQSPVAWSDFITGMDAGGHGIFDFIHRDPATYTPVFSAAEKTITLSRSDVSNPMGSWKYSHTG